MVAKPVEAIFLFRYTKPSVYKPTYGRHVAGDDDDYSKSHLQMGRKNVSPIAVAVERVFGPLSKGKTGEQRFKWRWPGDGGGSDGTVQESSDRLTVRWSGGHAPLPWRPTLTPAVGGQVIQGDPDLGTVAAANAQRDQIEAAGTEPWLVAVKVAGDRSLHTRAYLTNPPSDLESASVARLPACVRDEILKVTNGRIGGVVDLTSTTYAAVRATKIVDRVLAAFKHNRNVLLVGPPGTGKSVALEDLRALFELPPPVLFDAAATVNPWGEPDLPQGQGKVRSLVLHPSFSYEDLVIGLLPKPQGGAVGIEPHVGPLLALAHYASQDDRKALLILDEFNRGNAAAAFGDTLALLDTDKRTTSDRDGAVIDTPFADLDPQVTVEFSVGDSARDVLGPLTRFPDRLYIVAAMNSADRSVAPLDAALRRRFEIVYIGPDYQLLRGHLSAESLVPSNFVDATTKHVGELAVSVLEAVNDRVELVLGRDFLLGHALVWDLAAYIDADDFEGSLRHLARAFDDRIVATLRMTFTDQDEHLAAVLGMGREGSTAFARWRAVPPGLDGYASRRLAFQTLHEKTPEEIFGALSAVAGFDAKPDDATPRS